MLAQGHRRTLEEMLRMFRPWPVWDTGKGLDVRWAGPSPGQKAGRVRKAEAPVVCLWWWPWGVGEPEAGHPESGTPDPFVHHIRPNF